VQLFAYQPTEPGVGIFRVVLWREGQALFYAKTPYDMPERPLDELEPFASVAIDDVYALAPPDTAVATSVDDDDCHVKAVPVTDWHVGLATIGELFAREVRVLQALAHNPHPHLAE
jgi:hypothetical protein